MILSEASAVVVGMIRYDLLQDHKKEALRTVLDVAMAAGKLQSVNESLAERVASQSEKLARNAEKDTSRALYLIPLGILLKNIFTFDRFEIERELRKIIERGFAHLENKHGKADAGPNAFTAAGAASAGYGPELSTEKPVQ